MRDQFDVTEKWIYFNHAGVSPLARRTRRAMAEAAEMMKSGAAGAHALTRRIEQARERASRLLKCSADEVFFPGNTSEGLSVLAKGLRWKRGDSVVLPRMEFPSNVYPWMALASRGVEMRFAGTRERVETGEILGLIDQSTRVVSVSWVQFATGQKLPLSELGRELKELGVLFAVDAIQGLGVLEIDVREARVDFLAAGGHKWLLSPEGTAVAYVSGDLLDRVEPLSLGWGSVDESQGYLDHRLVLRDGARRYEAGTLNAIGLCGMSESLALLEEAGIANVESTVKDLTDLMAEGLRSRGYEVVSPREKDEWSGIVSFRAKADPENLVRHLRERGLYVVCREGLVRASPHFYNTEEDARVFLEQLP